MKKIIGVIFGLLVGFVIVSCFDTLAHVLFPFDGVYPSSIEEMKQLIEDDLIPYGQYFMMALGHLLAVSTGAIVCAMYIKTAKKPSYLVMGLLVVATLVNLLLLPHPLLFILIDVLAINIGVFIGYKFSRKITHK